jgi:lipopolysaccharide transport system ATP-binding protein
MNNDIIKINNLSKKYYIGTKQSYFTLRDSMTNLLNFKKRSFQSKPFWALKNINLSIAKGETIGIIGKNGAGKSTLLKILSRITPPTSGDISLNGRVASLLEVGTGFNPELTGRENIYLNGAILGMSQKEIKDKFDAIVNFSEVREFLDTPVKRYSSGMYVRLAFAVAAHLEPEILIIDEVLAVGDVRFQEKCLNRMKQVGEEGRTVIFVSHNLPAIEAFCSRVILLENGVLKMDGDAKSVIKRYLGNRQINKLEKKWTTIHPLENHSARVTKVALRSVNKNAHFTTDDEIEFVINYEIIGDKSTVGFTMMLNDNENRNIFASINNHEKNWYGKTMPKGQYQTSCVIPGRLLNNGWYSIDLNLFSSNYSDCINAINLIHFEVLDNKGVRGDYFGSYGGILRPQLKWETRNNGGKK